MHISFQAKVNFVAIAADTSESTSPTQIAADVRTFGLFRGAQQPNLAGTTTKTTTRKIHIFVQVSTLISGTIL